MPDLAKLQAMTGRFAPVEITPNLSTLPACEQQALAKLVEAGQVIDMIFLRQVWAGDGEPFRGCDRMTQLWAGLAPLLPDQ